MLYQLLYSFHDVHIIFNVFRYITFRIGLATITAFLICVLFGPWLIRKLEDMKVGQVIRDDGPIRHMEKAGTPTMGGILIVGAILTATLFWADLSNNYIWTAFIIIASYGLIGFLDDYLKHLHKNSKGLSARMKLILQFAFGTLALLFMFSYTEYEFQLSVPFFKKVAPNLGWFYFIFALVVIMGSSNSVNLTDGLDGLAIGPVAIVAATFAVFAYIAGRADFTEYLRLPYVPGSGELSIFCGAIFGAGLGFLWFNSYPAQVFMGDVGALALGSGIGLAAVITKQELVLLIVGGIFVAEALSVILQVFFYKWKKRRIFLMAPVHHHFEKKGWAEPKIIVRFWILQIILSLFAISTLKLR
jgi:phospho-N-acetylmuramoyl-pentapeptide-transferase